LCERLQREPDFAVLEPAGSADEAVATAFETKPDVILMDVDMPGLNCFDAARRIHSIRPETRIVFLSAFASDRYIEQALGVNAGGYMTKCETPEAVVAAVREVALGGVHFSDEVRARLVVEDQGARLASPGHPRLSRLTPRELEVLRYIASGLTQKVIAATMSVSIKTVENHCTNLMNKLDIHDRVELTRFAIREGIAQA
jgi:DNA-binding NarL/FixJ family response regulator